MSALQWKQRLEKQKKKLKKQKQDRREAGKQFHELLIGNYDLLERERDQPDQISMYEMMGNPIDVEQILKERIVPCKNRTTN